MVCSYKFAYFRRAILKIKKKLKFWYFQISRKVDAKCYKFTLQDQLLLHHKFYPPDYFLFSAKLEDVLFEDVEIDVGSIWDRIS